LLKAFVVMNMMYFAAFTTIVLTTRLSQPVLQAYRSHPVLTSFQAIFVQNLAKNSSLQAQLIPTPPDRGAPSDRRGAATYNN
jgi:hypothetical protein